MNITISTVDPSTGFETCIEPRATRRKRAQWIMWISKDGSGQLYVDREETGAIRTGPIMLPPNVARKRK